VVLAHADVLIGVAVYKAMGFGMKREPRWDSTSFLHFRLRVQQSKSLQLSILWHECG